MPLHTPLSALEQHDEFIGRHIGPCATEMSQMLADIGAASLDQLIDQTVPAAIRLSADLPLPAPRREHVALADLKAIASKNVVNKSCIGMGYYDTLTPKVILRTQAGVQAQPLGSRRRPEGNTPGCAGTTVRS